MSVPVTVAKKVVKREAKHRIEESAKKKAVKNAAKKITKKATDSAKTSGKKFMNSKIAPKMMSAPVSYSVRKQHNLLVGMWLASTITYIFAYYNSDGITIQTFWKRFIAIQACFFVLSILVLFETFAEVVGLFSAVVFLAILMKNGDAVMKGFSAIGKVGIIAPKGTVQAPVNAVPQGPVNSGTVNGTGADPSSVKPATVTIPRGVGSSIPF